MNKRVTIIFSIFFILSIGVNVFSYIQLQEKEQAFEYELERYNRLLTDFFLSKNEADSIVESFDEQGYYKNEIERLRKEITELEYSVEDPIILQTSAEIAIDENYLISLSSIANSNGGNAMIAIYHNGIPYDKYKRVDDHHIQLYPEPGSYTVYYEQFHNNAYRPISNVLVFEVKVGE